MANESTTGSTTARDNSAIRERSSGRREGLGVTIATLAQVPQGNCKLCHAFVYVAGLNS